MKLIDQLIEKIEMNIGQDINLDILSKEMHYSKFYISRIFNSTVGMSINQYIQSRRLSIAVQVLCEKKYSITDIAYGCGYNSASYFTKQFKITYGITPKEYMLGRYYIHLLEKVKIGEARMFKNIK